MQGNSIRWFLRDTTPQGVLALRVRSLAVSDLRLETKGSGFWDWLLTICRGKLSAVITR